MKDIKFRAWDSHLKVMHHNIHHLDSLNEFLNRDRYIVMQYTGLKAEGIEIYEGDIIRVHEDCGGTLKTWDNEVVFKYGNFSLVNKKCCEECRSGFGITCYLSDTPGKKEIVGNIYEGLKIDL